MYAIITGQSEGVAEWVCQQLKVTWIPGKATAIGLSLRGALIAGVLYEEYNGANISMHVAALPKAHWMTRKYLHVLFDYPFTQLKCKRVTAIVAESNKTCLKVMLHLGFQIEAILKDANPDGNLLVLVMFKADCRWIIPTARGHNV